MDLPPSGWYPDPYGTPSLLRWWDGTGWTQHTHPDVTAAGHGDGGTPAVTTVLGGDVAATALQGAVQDPVQATTVQAATVQAGTGQRPVGATSLQATTVQAGPVQAGTGRPSAEQLSQARPPTGPPTQPQPALPGGAGSAAPTAYQPATAVPGGYQPTAVHPGYAQSGAGWGPAGAAGAGTQVFAFGSEPWPGAGGPGPGGFPGGAFPPGNPYGYLEAQRRRRRRLIGGLAAGTVAAVAAIAVIVSSLGGSPATPVADQSPARPATPTASAAAAAAAATPTTSASASALASPSATTVGIVDDSQSGLSYSQLPAPWQSTASCPPALNNGAFPWTDGEYATAGQVNGNTGPVTWYGEACSGSLPQQFYNYTGTADLQTAADTLASTFENAYYSPLNHSITPGQDTPIQVSGHAAWEVSYDVTYQDAAAQGASWTDEQAAVVVVDNGSPTPAVFFVSIPATLNEGYISSLISSLQLNPQPGAAASGTASPTATASTTPGAPQGGGPGNGNGGGQGGGGTKP